ncbi:hypothetical protein BT93_F0666 [Corymbia citriodora subsp. variegata]|nr:hypothetical protein BT93_F0666 [Corymbia citriodora subsp. variegata]
MRPCPRSLFLGLMTARFLKMLPGQICSTQYRGSPIDPGSDHHVRSLARVTRRARCIV